MKLYLVNLDQYQHWSSSKEAFESIWLIASMLLFLFGSNCIQYLILPGIRLHICKFVLEELLKVLLFLSLQIDPTARHRSSCLYCPVLIPDMDFPQELWRFWNESGCELRSDTVRGLARVPNFSQIGFISGQFSPKSLNAFLLLTCMCNESLYNA